MVNDMEARRIYFFSAQGYADIDGFPKSGVPFEGPHNKDYCILGCKSDPTI